MALPIDIEVIDAAIAGGVSLSPEVPLGAKTLVGVAMPAAWTAASITFQVSPDGGTTWLDLVDSSGSEVAITASANQFVQIDPAVWRGINMVKVRSGTSSAPVNQGADALVGLVVRSELY